MDAITIGDYFEPISKLKYRETWVPILDIYEKGGEFPKIEKNKIVIFSVNEDRAEVNGMHSGGEDQIRQSFYSLFPKEFSGGIADLGHLKIGKEIKDTYKAVEDICYSLLSYNKTIIVLGGTQDISYAVSRAYSKFPLDANILSIDPEFDIGDPDKPITNKNYMGHSVTQPPNKIFNYTNLGNQSYATSEEARDLMDRLLFDDYRYGILRSNIEDTEPPIRDADFVSVDMSAVRKSDSPGSAYSFPTGFSAEEMCQMMRYSGMSYQTSILGIFEYYPQKDRDFTSAMLIAQMIWCFVEGVEHRLNDYPAGNTAFEYKIYTVVTDGGEMEVEFYKCKQTDHWWMLLPCNEEQKRRYGRHYFIPCTYNDYQWALSHGKPDRWWRAYTRLK